MTEQAPALEPQQVWVSTKSTEEPRRKVICVNSQRVSSQTTAPDGAVDYVDQTVASFAKWIKRHDARVMEGGRDE